MAKRNLSGNFRRVVLISSFEDEMDLNHIMNVPYNGAFDQFLEDRFNIQIHKDDIHAREDISIPKDVGKVAEWLAPI